MFLTKIMLKIANINTIQNEYYLVQSLENVKEQQIYEFSNALLFYR